MVFLLNPDRGFCNGVAYATGIGKEGRGSRVVSYSATPEYDEVSLSSISAMPHYQDRNHEEMRLEDYEQLGKGFSFPIQHQGNAFRQSNSPFGPCTSPLPSSQSTGIFPIQKQGNLSGTFGTETAAPVSDSSVKPLFGSTSAEMFSFPKSSGVGFNSCPSTSTHGSSSWVFGTPNTYVPSFPPSSARSDFGTSFGISSISVSEGPSIPAFKVPTTPEFGITSTPLNRCSFGIQTSSGSHDTTSTTHQGSGAVPYFVSRDYDRSKNTYTGGRFHSISAMPSYQDKSHEELRSEDYGLQNKGVKCSSFCLETSGAPSNIFCSEPQSNQSSNYSPFGSFKSSFFEPNRENFITPSNTISTAPALFPSVNPLFCTNVNLSKSKTFGFTPRPTTASFMPTFTPNLYPPTLIHFADTMLQNSRECPETSPTITQGASVGTFSLTKPSVTVTPFIQPTSVSASDPWPFIVKSSQPQQTAENMGSLSTNDLIKPFQCKGDEVEGNSSPFQLNENSTRSADNTTTQHEDRSATLNRHQDDVAARTERHGADHVLALLPKLPDGGYYTEPSLHKLAAKEMEEPGFCSHVKEFVVGRQGYGSVKFLGETDVRHLDIKSIVQFNNREVIVYPDGRKKPGVGQELNKAGEVTLLNVKCINKKTEQQYVEGHLVESYQELLIKTTLEHGAEFVSFDPVEGEWKFRVPHF